MIKSYFYQHSFVVSWRKIRLYYDVFDLNSLSKGHFRSNQQNQVYETNIKEWNSYSNNFLY